MDIIKDYNIKERVDTFILNNADSNDIAIRYIINTLNLYDTYKEESVRLYYLNHIINLAATDFLFDKNSKEFL